MTVARLNSLFLVHKPTKEFHSKESKDKKAIERKHKIKADKGNYYMIFRFPKNCIFFCFLDKSCGKKNQAIESSIDSLVNSGRTHSKTGSFKGRKHFFKYFKGMIWFKIMVAINVDLKYLSRYFLLKSYKKNFEKKWFDGVKILFYKETVYNADIRRNTVEMINKSFF